MKYTILIFLLSLQLVSCKNGKNNEATKEFECPYRELQNEETEGRIENGNFINGEIDLALESNLKKLGKGKLGINFKDSSIINSNLKLVKT